MLKQIKYFQSVVRNQNFTEAAEECFISQSAISQQIQALEKELGVKLIEREKRKFVVTPAGEYFYKKSLALMADFEELCKETKRMEKVEQKELSIGYLKSYGGSEVQQTVLEFSNTYPNMPVRIEAGNHEELYRHLREGRMDVVLSDQRRAFSDEYVNLILSEEDCFIEVDKRNPIAFREAVSTEELKQEPCILVASKEHIETEREYYHDIVGFRGEFFFVDTIEEARLMVVGNKGFMPIEGGELPIPYQENIVRVPLVRGNKTMKRTYCAFWKTANSGYYIEEFAEILKERFKSAL